MQNHTFFLSGNMDAGVKAPKYIVSKRYIVLADEIDRMGGNNRVV